MKQFKFRLVEDYWNKGAADIAIEYAKDMEGMDYWAEDETDAIYNYINDQLIWYDDQWKIMQAYQTPQEANLSEAFEALTDDLLSIVEAVEVKEIEVDDLDIQYEAGDIVIYYDNEEIFTDSYFVDVEEDEDEDKKEWTEEDWCDYYRAYLEDEAGEGILEIIKETIKEKELA